jgi:hypothetical protein
VNGFNKYNKGALGRKITIMKNLLLITLLAASFNSGCKPDYSDEPMDLYFSEDAIMDYDISSTRHSRPPAPAENIHVKYNLAFEDLMEVEPATSKSVEIDRKIIKTGRITFRVESLSETDARIAAANQKTNAFIASESTADWQYRTVRTMTVRVQADQFDELVKMIGEGVATFDKKDIISQDVTEEFVDVQARLNTKKELEQRYLALLKQATKVLDMLEIERELGKVRADIESMQGRLNYLKDQVAMSTIHLSYYKEHPEGLGFGSRVDESLSRGWNGVVNVFLGIISIWPLWVLLAVITWALVRRHKRKKREMEVWQNN